MSARKPTGPQEFVLVNLEPRALVIALYAGIASPHWNALEKQLARLLLDKMESGAGKKRRR